MYMESDWHACCVCGCGGNEDLDDLVPCLCEASSALVHLSCAAVCKGSARHTSLQCLICGGHGVPCNGDSSLCHGVSKAAKRHCGATKRPTMSVQASGIGVKRSRPNGMANSEDLSESGPLWNRDKRESSTQSVKIDTTDTGSEKSGVALLGRRFTDAPAIVPIKKRRIQMAEVMRSPSPPPRSPSPVIQSPSPALLSPESMSLTQGPLPFRGVSPQLRSPSPRSPCPPPRSPSPESPLPPERSSLPSKSLLVGVGLSTGDHVPSLSQVEESSERKEVMALHCSSPALGFGSLKTSQSQDIYEVEGEVITSARDCPGVDGNDTVGESSESVREASGYNTQDAMDQRAAVKGLQEIHSPESSHSHDHRSRWDLNMEVEAWERVTEEDGDKEFEVRNARELLCSSTADSDESMHRKKPNFLEDVVKVQPDQEPDAEELVDYGNSECKYVDDNEMGAEERVVRQLQIASDLKAEAGADYCDLDKHASYRGKVDGGEISENKIEEHQEDAPDSQKYEPKFEKQATSYNSKVTGRDQLPEEPEVEEHVDYGDSDCRYADDMALEMDQRTSMALQDESEWKVEEASGKLEVDNLTNGEGELNSDDGETEGKSGILGGDLKASVHDKDFQELSLEKHGTSRRTKPTGWDQLPEGFDSAEEALRAAKENSRRGRGGPWIAFGGRGSMLGSQGAQAGRHLGSGRGAFRGHFASARADRIFGGRSQSDERGRDRFSNGRRLDGGFDASLRFVSPLDMGRGRNLRGLPVGRMHRKGRADGWIDTQGGSLSEWSRGWRQSTAHFGPQMSANAAAVAAARVESSGFVVARDGTITKAGNTMSAGRGAMQTTIGSRGSRGSHNNIHRGPPVDMEAGSNLPMRFGLGTGEMNSSSNAGMNMDRRGSALIVGPGLVRGLSGRGGPAGRGSMGRYRVPPFGSGGTDSRRSESPRRLTQALEHSGGDRHAIQSFRPESKVERSTPSPPAHHSLDNSTLAPSHSQQTLPPPSKWSSENREVDTFQDWEYKRLASHSHMPPRRTSPHVVHGSSLMDERDRQVLAGARHSSPNKEAINCCGKFGDCSSDIRRTKRDEDDDCRLTGSRLKEGDHGWISPREVDKVRDKKGSVYRRERSNDRKWDSSKFSSKDGRSTSGHKHTSIWEGDDDVAPRRRRPS